MKKIFLLAPDKGSGYAFQNKLKKHDINSILHFYTIAPRVIVDKINYSRTVTNQFEKALSKSFSFGLPVVVACNTLQFWLSKISKRILRRGKIITTFKACKVKYIGKIKPVWLGTSPTSSLIKFFPSLYKMGLLDLQTKVQELIWRIKLLNGDDVSSAPKVVLRDRADKNIQKEKIKVLKKEIINGLVSNNIFKVILGCTELPQVFKRNKIKGIRFYDPADILANYIKTSKL